MNYILARLREGSTHGGLAMISQVLKVMAPQYAGIFDALTALFAAIAVTIPDPGRPA